MAQSTPYSPTDSLWRWGEWKCANTHRHTQGDTTQRACVQTHTHLALAPFTQFEEHIHHTSPQTLTPTSEKQHTHTRTHSPSTAVTRWVTDHFSAVFPWLTFNVTWMSTDAHSEYEIHLSKRHQCHGRSNWACCSGCVYWRKFGCQTHHLTHAHTKPSWSHLPCGPVYISRCPTLRTWTSAPSPKLYRLWHTEVGGDSFWSRGRSLNCCKTIRSGSSMHSRELKGKFGF